MAGSDRMWQPRVLVVDDYPAVLQSIARRLRLDGIHVHEAFSGEHAASIAHQATLDLALIDYHLPGISGLETGTLIQSPDVAVPWILFSGQPDDRMAMAAVSHGALDVIWAPFQAVDVVRKALEASDRRRVDNWSRVLEAGNSTQPRTMMARAAWWILRACESPDDLPTIEAWARFVGISYSSFRDGLSRIGIQPREARGFMRVLRALGRTGGRLEHIEGELVVGDSRTARDLMRTAGLAEKRPARPVTLQSFLAHQRFIPGHHPLLLALRSTLMDR